MSVDLEAEGSPLRRKSLAYGFHPGPGASFASQNIEFRQAERALQQIALQGRRPITSDTMALAKLFGADVFSTILNEWPKSGQRRVLSPVAVDQLVWELRGWLRERLLGEKTSAPISVPRGQAVSTLRGKPRGTLLSLKDGKARLAQVTTTLATEDWAGQVRKPFELVAELGIARSTLAVWRERGDVLAFKAGKVKHVYPLEQFVDGYPLPGLARLRAIAPSDRALWVWLKTRSPQLGGELPLDQLKRGQIDSVQAACEVIFGSI
jgi:hypothetical protein